MNAILDQIGPDDEIEQAGIEFEAWRQIHPHSPMTFELYVKLQTPRPSNSWVYASNRQGRTLVSF